jgi:hypothetical protein
VRTPTPARATLYQSSAEDAGTKRMGTTAGWVREKKSTKSLSNIRGESGLAFNIVSALPYTYMRIRIGTGEP